MPEPMPASPFVRTVTGDIPSEEIGFTHAHEHTFILPGPSARLNPELRLDELDRTVAELKDFFACGGRTVVDAQPIGLERSPTLDLLASQHSDVRIVATSGLHRAAYYDPDHFRFHESVDQLARRMIAEITSGMIEYGPAGQSRPTEIRAGLLKFASDYHVIDDHARKAAEAVAAAHRQCGAAILTHTERGTCGMEQVELFGKLGVEPSALVISHLDRNPDIYLHDEVARSGAYLVYDGVSRVKYFPDSTLVDLIGRMVERGHASQILLGMDMGPRSMWRAYGGGPGMTYLARVFLPKLRRAGLGDDEICQFTVYNASRALPLRERKMGTGSVAENVG